MITAKSINGHTSYKNTKSAFTQCVSFWQDPDGQWTLIAVSESFNGRMNASMWVYPRRETCVNFVMGYFGAL